MSLQRVRHTRKSFIFILFPLFALAGCTESNSAPAAERSALLVDVDVVEPASEYALALDFIGRVEPTRQSQVGFELAGELMAVTVDEGDIVSTGDVIARLDTARLEARLEEALAVVDEARSARNFARRTYERNRDAAEFGGISEQQVDLALDASNAAGARLIAAEARVNSVRVDIEKSTLVSPYDAVVTDRMFDEGNVVAAGSPIVHLQERALPEVRVGVSGELAPMIAAGDGFDVSIAGQDVPATVRAVLPVRDPATRTVDVILQLTIESNVYPGDIARLRLERSVEEAGFWLPVTALTEGSRGLWTVNVVRAIDYLPANGATHVVEARSVEVLHKDDDRVFVRGALTAGDRYVTSGMQRIVPNQEVRVADALARNTTEVANSE